MNKEKPNGIKRRFPNSKEQLKAMRNQRKKQKRLGRSACVKNKRADKVTAEGQALVKAKLDELERAKKKHDYLARRYYDRWRTLKNSTGKKGADATHEAKNKICIGEFPLQVNTIDRGHLEKMLCKNGVIIEGNIGEGSFGYCSKMLYHGIPVAVKQFKGLSSLADVKKEASTISKLSHQGIPYIYGICTTKPYLLVMNFYCINGQSYTLKRMLYSTTQHLSHQSWVKLLTDVIEALLFIHGKLFIHRDIKGDNIVVSYYNNKHVPVIIDFGKCVNVCEDIKCKVMTEAEQLLYLQTYPHIAPEVAAGSRPSFPTDIYSLGLILNSVYQKKLHPCVPDLQNVVTECTKVEPCQRPSLLKVLEVVSSLFCKCPNKSINIPLPVDTIHLFY